MFGIAAIGQGSGPGETGQSTIPLHPTLLPALPPATPASKGWSSPPSNPWGHLPTALNWINVASVCSSALLLGFDGWGEMRKPMELQDVGAPDPHIKDRSPVGELGTVLLSVSRAQAEGQCPVVRQNSAWTEGQARSVSQDDMMALQGRLCLGNPLHSLLCPCLLRESLIFHAGFHVSHSLRDT